METIKPKKKKKNEGMKIERELRRKKVLCLRNNKVKQRTSFELHILGTMGLRQ